MIQLALENSHLFQVGLTVSQRRSGQDFISPLESDVSPVLPLFGQASACWNWRSQRFWVAIAAATACRS